MKLTPTPQWKFAQAIDKVDREIAELQARRKRLQANMERARLAQENDDAKTKP